MRNPLQLSDANITASATNTGAQKTAGAGKETREAAADYIPTLPSTAIRFLAGLTRLSALQYKDYGRYLMSLLRLGSSQQL